MIFKKTSYCVNVQSHVFNDSRLPGSCKGRVAATLGSLKSGILKKVSPPCGVSWSSNSLKGS
jgi:hypothetical protein